jgi:microcystin-dependent protein
MANFGDVKSDQLQEYFYIPPSVIFPYSGTAAPTGFLFCDGSTYGTATYPTLFNAIGYTYGGAGTAFSVPDLRGRAIAGKDMANNGGGTALRLTTSGAGINGTVLGTASGAEVYALGSAQLPSHSHSASASTASLNHQHSGNVNSGGGHSHGMDNASFFTYVIGLSQNSYGVNVGVWADGGGPAYRGEHSHGIQAAADHTHSFSTGFTDLSHGHTITVNTAGNGSAHPNVQPTIVLHYIIKV